MTGTLADSQRKFGVIVDEVQDTVGAAFMNVAQAVLPAFLDAFTAVSDWVTSVIPTVQATLGAFLDGTSGGMVVITDTILPALGAAFDWLTPTSCRPSRASSRPGRRTSSQPCSAPSPSSRAGSRTTGRSSPRSLARSRAS